MAMINMYRFGLAPKFTGIGVAAVLSTGILVSLTMFYESRHRLREQIIANNEANVTLADVPTLTRSRHTIFDRKG
jgi:hypothetical protein